jgi:hypothetical protein
MHLPQWLRALGASSPSDAPKIRLPVRLAIAALLGDFGYALVWTALQANPRFLAKDFTWPWRAARAIAAGYDPYQVIQTTGPFPFSSPFFYPLPAALVALPLAPLPADRAGAVFFGISVALLAFAVTRDSFGRLLLFTSAPFFMAAANTQWSPLLMAAALLPNVQGILAAKPTVGLAAFVYRPSWRGVIGGAILVAISFAILPRWPLEWREALAATPDHAAPILRFGAPVLLLALRRWRTPEGRLLATMGCVPQVMYFYDQLMLFLVPRGWRGMLALSASSWIAWIWWWRVRPAEGGGLDAAEPMVMALIYVPALIVLLAEGRSAVRRSSTEEQPVGVS